MVAEASMKKTFLCVLAALAFAVPAMHAQQIAGTWQGTIPDGKDSLRVVVKITDDDKKLRGALYSIDQGADPLALSSITLKDGSLSFAIALINGRFTGKLSADANSIAGEWTEGKDKPDPLTLVRADKDAAWEIPKPNAPMARDAKPAFDVATIKPSKPGEEGSGYGLDGRHITTVNTSLDNLIGYAYDIHRKQIVASPDWADSDKFDIAGVPDLPGEPSDPQMKLMIQKLLADRFQLKFHREQKELSVYVLSVAKGSPKNLTRSAATGEGFSIPIGGAKGGVKMTVWNGTMTNFAIFGLQGAVVDRPVVDRTGLTDRYDFALKWMPDDSQFGGHMQIGAVKDPLPDLFTAMQQQLGLKLEPMKAPVDVLVIDAVAKPSEN
jgi:uncharacterized protein (TIGR03435 family)